MSTSTQRGGKQKALALPLTPEESALLAQHEFVIGQGLQAFVAVGQALLDIRDQKLYRSPEHKTFEEYCKKRWNIGTSHAYRLIEAAEVVKDLSPIGGQIVQNERQARALAEVPPHLRDEVLQRLRDAEEAITEQSVTKAVCELIDEKRQAAQDGTGLEQDEELEAADEEQEPDQEAPAAPSNATLRASAKRHAKPTLYVPRGNEHQRLALKDAKKAKWTDLRTKKNLDLALQSAQMAEDTARIWRELAAQAQEAKAA